MNQIIYPEKIEKNLIAYKNSILQKRRAYHFLFIFSTISLIIFICYYLFAYFRIIKKENFSQKILSVYNIQQLYSSSSSLPIELPSVISESGDIATIVGIIEIDNINLRYPILSKTTDEFLKIAPCKFSGNSLNENGNFCIAGHNYDNGEFFSDLNLLQINDTIRLYTLNR